MTVVQSTSSMALESSGSIDPKTAIPTESVAAIISQLALQLDFVEAEFQRVGSFSDTLASDTAALLNEGRIATALLRQEVTSEHPRFDVIHLCHLVINRLIASGGICINAFILSAGAAAGRTIGHEAALKLLTVDLPAVLAHLERWMEFHR